ncbi:hypothetical protein Efla_003563 [Eimeria flavescens]
MSSETAALLPLQAKLISVSKTNGHKSAGLRYDFVRKRKSPSETDWRESYTNQTVFS